MRSDTIIIPDIHGRTFWRDAVSGRESCRVIFLGDYVDPYPREGITPTQALKELEDILMFKKEHMDTVSLLLGNHDLGYVDENVCGCRHDYYYESRINDILMNNLDCFELCVEEVTPSGKAVLFSHAGVHPVWVRLHPELFPEGRFEASGLNLLFHDGGTRQTVLNALGDVSDYRGGWKTAGSIVWADIHEFSSGEAGGPIQVVGHTQMSDGPIWVKDVLCLDCKRYFLAGDIKWPGEASLGTILPEN